MPAPKGHPMWSNMKKRKRFETPEDLWNQSILYFEWCNDNPWYKNEAIKSGPDTGKIIKIPIGRPYTLQGLCNFLMIDFQTFRNYEVREGYEKYFEIAKEIRSIIEQNQLEGASVNAYNSNIIARLLGLVDKQENKVVTDKPIEIKVIKSETAFPTSEDEIDLNKEI